MTKPPKSPLRQGLQRRGFGLTLLIVEFGVLSSFLFSLALYIFGTVQTVRTLWDALRLVYHRQKDGTITPELVRAFEHRFDALLDAGLKANPLGSV